ncbi:unnamed protein product [Vitrella brassicaformis CCMP3155]|uniref:USP domain-containing protein n=1 Tax=Vitrella brassicaformis (strain CCMP3155) TaxID=1169540 RepID=A0A0G4GZ31_VITBC|nr:unnamed protein product [Vitrella brassicaformis CCMP3155]|eukprot:CEM36204.1 unnamed protein product [Vitrella brassicaformis CCMP3155]
MDCGVAAGGCCTPPPAHISVPNPFDSPPEGGDQTPGRAAGDGGNRAGDGDLEPGPEAERRVNISVSSAAMEGPLQCGKRNMKKWPRTVLENVTGNGCYLNASLQEIMRVQPFAANLIQNMEYLVAHKEEIIDRYEASVPSLTERNEREAQLPKGTSHRDLQTDPRTSLLWETVLLNSYMWGKTEQEKATPSGEAPTVCLRPESMYRTLVRSSHHLGMGTQEDAAEAIECLLKTLHQELVAIQELARTRNSGAPKDMTLKEAGKDTTTSTAASKIFGGALESVVTCCECGNVTRRREQMFNLSVQIPKKAVDLTGDGGEGEGKGADAGGCIHSFFQKETMAGDNKYQCDKCCKKVVATRQYVMAETPKLLPLHLKRFQGLGKNEDHVDLQEQLDLSPYTDRVDDDGHEAEPHELTGVIVHHGRSLKGGHYTACVRRLVGGKAKWFRYDDSAPAGEVDLQFVLGQQAYMAFYTQPATLKATALPMLEDAPPPPPPPAPAPTPAPAQPAAAPPHMNRNKKRGAKPDAPNPKRKRAEGGPKDKNGLDELAVHIEAKAAAEGKGAIRHSSRIAGRKGKAEVGPELPSKTQKAISKKAKKPKGKKPKGKPAKARVSPPALAAQQVLAAPPNHQQQQAEQARLSKKRKQAGEEQPAEDNRGGKVQTRAMRRRLAAQPNQQ